MMVRYYSMIALGLLSAAVCGMENKRCQLDFCPTRKAYYQQVAVNQQNQKPLCFFCDPDTLQTNYILREDDQSNIREMMNKLLILILIKQYISLSCQFHIKNIRVIFHHKN